MQKTVVFIISRSPFGDDRPYHLIRMALSLAMDAKPVLMLTGDALLFDAVRDRKGSSLPDVAGQIRLFTEMVGDAYRTELIPPAVPLAEVTDREYDDVVATLSPEEARTYIRNADAVFSC